MMKLDPFKIIEPTCISFSGGRTSAYMLWRVLQSHDGKLPDEAIVCFANTGKEDEATLRFVQACAEHWDIHITWLEYQPQEPGFKVVTFDTASRNGEPFQQIGITKDDVGHFWRAQAFDLGLPNHNGVTSHGNCDLCFLKGANQILSLIAEKPERAIWWANMENSITNAKINNGDRFRSDRPSYSQMLKYSQEQKDMFDPNEEAIACFCGD